MLNYIAGIVIFLLVLLAKQSLARALLLKKQVAISVVTIVISEALMLLMVYLSIRSFGLDGRKILVGFLMSTMLTIAVYFKRFMAKKSGIEKNG